MSIKRFICSALAVALIAGAITTSFSTSAEAGRRGHAAGAAAAAGVIGLAAGAIIAGAAAQPRVYYAPAPRRHVVPAGRYQPWTPAWYRYCHRRYRSFNPNTGYFLAYSGQYRFCM